MNIYLAVLIENCFDNASFPYTSSGVDDGRDEDVVSEAACPMNIYRTGGDMRADWPLMLRRLQTIVPWLRLSRPGVRLVTTVITAAAEWRGSARARACVHTRLPHTRTPLLLLRLLLLLLHLLLPRSAAVLCVPRYA